MENVPFEDVSPIKSGGFPLPEGMFESLSEFTKSKCYCQENM